MGRAIGGRSGYGRATGASGVDRACRVDRTGCAVGYCGWRRRPSFLGMAASVRGLALAGSSGENFLMSFLAIAPKTEPAMITIAIMV